MHPVFLPNEPYTVTFDCFEDDQFNVPIEENGEKSEIREGAHRVDGSERHCHTEGNIRLENEDYSDVNAVAYDEEPQGHPLEDTVLGAQGPSEIVLPEMPFYAVGSLRLRRQNEEQQGHPHEETFLGSQGPSEMVLPAKQRRQ